MISQQVGQKSGRQARSRYKELSGILRRIECMIFQFCVLCLEILECRAQIERDYRTLDERSMLTTSQSHYLK